MSCYTDHSDHSSYIWSHGGSPYGSWLIHHSDGWPWAMAGEKSIYRKYPARCTTVFFTENKQSTQCAAVVRIYHMYRFCSLKNHLKINSCICNMKGFSMWIYKMCLKDWRILNTSKYGSSSLYCNAWVMVVENPLISRIYYYIHSTHVNLLICKCWN